MNLPNKEPKAPAKVRKPIQTQITSTQAVKETKLEEIKRKIRELTQHRVKTQGINWTKPFLFYRIQ